MSVVNRLEQIRARILNSVAMIYTYRENWGDEYCFERLGRTFSKQGSFDFDKVETITLEELQSLEKETLYNFGFGNWKEELLLIPLWLVKFLDQSMQVVSIMGSTSTLADCDKDVRWGCIAFGFVKEKPVLAIENTTKLLSAD